MKKTEIKNIQGLRGVAALMVLAAHIVLVDGNLSGGGILPAQLRIGIAGVDLFFLISGFVMVHVADRTPAGRRGAARFLFNRAGRIYPLYWIATLMMLPLFWIRERLFDIPPEAEGLIPSLLLAPQESLPVLVVGWTLIHEMYFYLVFGLILFVAPKRKFLLLAIWGVIVGVAYFLGLMDINPWLQVAFNPLTFEFLAGAAIALLIKNTTPRWPVAAIVLGVVIILIQLFLFNETSWEGMNRYGERTLLYGPPFAFILYGAAALEKTKSIIAPRWLTATGDASYSLYLFHLPIAVAIGQFIDALIGDRGTLDNLIVIIACIVGPISAAFIIHKFLERPLLTGAKKLGDRLIAPGQTQIKPERAW